MKFLKKNILTISMFTLLLVMGFAGNASALAVNVGGGSGDLMGIAESKVKNIFLAVKTIVFIIGGFGLVALAFAAIFGKVKWSWFAGLALGLALLAAAGAIVDYATGESSHKNDLSDTFQSAAPGRF